MVLIKIFTGKKKTRENKTLCCPYLLMHVFTCTVKEEISVDNCKKPLLAPEFFLSQEPQAIFRIKEIKRVSRNSTEHEPNVKIECWESDK